MRLYLARTLEGIRMYGPIYDLGSAVPEKVDDYIMEMEEHDWLLDNLVDEINSACDTLLDDGDVDYFDVDKCNNLLSLLDNLENDFVPEYCKRLLLTLREYATYAVENSTGIAIEL